LTEDKAMPYHAVMDHEKLIEACKKIGGQSALARALGVKPPTVNEWIKSGRPVPADRCIDIELATQGAVRCEDLRPDINWKALRATDCPVIPQRQEAA